MFFWGPLLEVIGPLREELVLYLNKQLQCDSVPKILSGSVLNGTNWGEAEMRDRSGDASILSSTQCCWAGSHKGASEAGGAISWLARPAAGATEQP